MDIYDKYKNGRDMAWKALLESGVSRLPVNLKAFRDFITAKSRYLLTAVIPSHL